MDPYDTLGVRKNATQKEIELAYTKLLDKYDLNNYPGDPTFANIRVEKNTEAYNFLSDTKKKLEYDKEHISHIESHKNKKDVFNPYYKKINSSEHIHEDMKIAQDKYEKFQKYSKQETNYQILNFDERSKKAVTTIMWIFVTFFIIIPLLQFIPAIIALLSF